MHAADAAPPAARPGRDLLAEYEQGHQHPVNRLCHTLGIPMIVLSLPLLAWFAPWGQRRSRASAAGWRGAWGLFTLGWVFQFVGHAFERRLPEFLRDWRFLFVGTRWWLLKTRRQLHRAGAHVPANRP